MVAMGRQSDDATHYPIISSSTRYLLWEFRAFRWRMTDAGRKAFVNAARSTSLLRLILDRPILIQPVHP